MASVFDVAAYILQKRGSMTTMKLQKLVYYSQAWSLVWDGEKLFDEPIQAWANGPVVPVLYRAHQGKFTISSMRRGDSGQLSDVQCETIDVVLDFYGKKSPQWLSDLTHMEEPWRRAYGNTPPGMRCDEEITLESMAEYYERLSS